MSMCTVFANKWNYLLQLYLFGIFGRTVLEKHLEWFFSLTCSSFFQKEQFFLIVNQWISVCGFFLFRFFIFPPPSTIIEQEKQEKGDKTSGTRNWNPKKVSAKVGGQKKSEKFCFSASCCLVGRLYSCLFANGKNVQIESRMSWADFPDCWAA